jgi:hypothetical protein
MKKHSALPGTSLIELTVGAALMGLLFMSGLQLLASLLQVQTHVSSTQTALNIKPLLLKTQLQQALQEAEQLTMSADALTIRFQNQTGTHQLRFQHTPHDWYLWQDQEQLAHWSLAAIQQKPRFQQLGRHLLQIQLPTTQTSVSIWLRND